MEYFVAIGSQREGPMTLQELIARRPSPDTLVWRFGLAQWTPAGTLVELRQHLQIEPPLLDQGTILPSERSIVTTTSTAPNAGLNQLSDSLNGEHAQRPCTTSASIHVRCQCGKKLRANEKAAGKLVKCPACGVALTLPSLSAQESASNNEPSVPMLPKLADERLSTPQIAKVSDSFWLHNGSVPTGPFTMLQIRVKLARSEISLETAACAVGNGEWIPLRDIIDLKSERKNMEPPPPVPSAFTPAVSVAYASPARKLDAGTAHNPWNPAAIAWMGLIFTPMWAGVMAALNGRRLGSQIPFWRPLAIGFGSLAMSCLLGVWIDSNILDVLLYLGATWAIWQFVLRPQYRLHAGLAESAIHASGRWTWPIVAGIPLAIVAFLGFVVAPLMPLEPREVCERFTNAKTAKEALKYVTLNLEPAVMATLNSPSSSTEDPFELTQEGIAPADLGGYLVGFRGQITIPGESRRVQIEGVFHLIEYDVWKIEDIYFLTVDHQPFNPPISLARNYKWLVTPNYTGPTRGYDKPSATTTNSAAQRSNTWTTNSTSTSAVAMRNSRPLFFVVGKTVGSLLAGAFAAMLAWLFPSPKSLPLLESK
jgi:hypothetical protein